MEAMRLAHILHCLGCCRKEHRVAVIRDDLVGKCIGHTPPKSKTVLKMAMGGVLFTDEACYLHRPENKRDLSHRLASSTPLTLKAHHAAVTPLDADALPDRRTPPIPRRQR